MLTELRYKNFENIYVHDVYNKISSEFDVTRKYHWKSVKTFLDSLKKDVMKSIKTLPDRERLALVLYYYEELTLQEIANVINVSESRVSQILNKTLMKIRVAVIEE